MALAARLGCMPDAFGSALRDFHRGDLDEPLVQRDGEETLEHPIEEFYYGSFDPDSEAGAWIESRVDGPLLDVGAGAGRDTLYFQERFETVALEVSDALVETMTDRGVRNARSGDMFALTEQFDADRFQSALVVGTQVGLAGSTVGLEAFLADLAAVTRDGGTAVLDGYDPTNEDAEELLGYRADPTPGLAHRVMAFEYDGAIDPILHFRLFAPDRLRAAAEATPWTVTDVRESGDSCYYRVALEKAHH